MTVERGEAGESLQQKKFRRLLEINYTYMEQVIRNASTVHLLYTVVTPKENVFAIIGVRESREEDKKTYGSDEIALLAIDPQAVKMVGFTYNQVRFTGSKNPYAADGVIATSVPGHYYGQGLEVACQHYFQELANSEQREVDYRIMPLYTSTTAWDHLYGKGNIFGYDNRKKLYKPTASDTASAISSRPQGFSIISSRVDGVTSWQVHPNPDIIKRAAPLGLLDQSKAYEILQQARFG